MTSTPGILNSSAMFGKCSGLVLILLDIVFRKDVGCRFLIYLGWKFLFNYFFGSLPLFQEEDTTVILWKRLGKDLFESEVLIYSSFPAALWEARKAE